MSRSVKKGPYVEERLMKRKISVLDVSNLTLAQCVEYVDQWIMSKIKESEEIR